MQKKLKTTRWIIGVVIIAASLLALDLFATSASVKTIANPGVLPGLIKGSTPWSANTDDLVLRLKDIGLPPLRREGTALHIHTHIDISINGQPVLVPAGVGIDQIARFISPIHTHRANGVIHVESPSVQTFTLGQFFDVWGVRFTSRCIGGYCATSDSGVKVYVNGTRYKKDVRLLPIKEREEIFITYGKNNKAPATIPATYAFPPDE